MDLVAEYQRRAEDAERMARMISFEPDREAMMEIARSWRRMAEDRRQQLAKREHPQEPG